MKSIEFRQAKIEPNRYLPDPEIGKGLEFGVRYSTPDNSLDTQLAFYAIEKEMIMNLAIQTYSYYQSIRVRKPLKVT